jgi:uroporphyrinogen decarboxylase
MKQMTSRERVETVFRGELPDRVPMHDLSNLVIAKAMGYQMKDVRFDAEKSVDATLKFNKMTGSDFLLVPIIETPAMFMDLGVDVTLPDDNYGNVMSNFFATPEDIDSKQIYDPFDPKASKYMRLGITDKIALLNKKNKTDALTAGWSWGVMTTAGFLRGVETLLMDTMVEPELAKKVIKKASKLVDGVMSVGMDSGSDSVWLPDPTASGTAISKETFDEFVGGETKKLFKKWYSKYKKPSIYHVCGDTIPIMDSMPGLGMDCLSVDHLIDIAVAKAKIGDKLTIMGNINPITVVWNGKPQDVMAASKVCIDKAAKNGRYILSTGCEIPRDAPVENVHAMLLAAEKYGRY